jgi:hypothetical protein
VGPVEDDEENESLKSRNRCSTPAGTKTWSSAAIRLRAPVDLDLSCAGEHHVDLVERVRRLRVGGWREEDVDTKLEPRRLVDHLVAAPGGL